MKKIGNEAISTAVFSTLTWTSLWTAGILWAYKKLSFFSNAIPFRWYPLDSYYRSIVDSYSLFTLTYIGQTVITLGIYWIIGSIYMIIEFVPYFSKYRVQPKVNGLRSITLFKEISGTVLRNQIFVTIPTFFVLALTKIVLYPYHSQISVPTYSEAALQFLSLILIEEVCFYYSHRLLHHPSLYKKYHKQHHNFTAPVGISAIYCSPLEHLLSNVLPVGVAPVMLNTPLPIYWIWFLITAPYGVIVHSGFHLPFLPSPEFHDFHHLKFNVNYGILGICDRLHGTDDAFVRNVASRRHKVIIGTASAHELFPD